MFVLANISPFNIDSIEDLRVLFEPFLGKCMSDLRVATTGSRSKRAGHNIACPSWMDGFFGGLQFQLEHHLFPRLPRCQLRKVSPVVKDLSKKREGPKQPCSEEFAVGSCEYSWLRA
ncbi:hypothetical protein F3Y22_tig00110793pilonHSYRG00116 [Hibiscus syriacus]|uniref:Fatty acid desaturase domain-containing protein n=1 Tax=Hibiscus syriacus TaxID=106335 RepID=A0A6A2ZRS7_HIBSY|nr:hypothetical protein F3Y22_tig00110793pilonHSYRG00116 [Hibiscus syriacus]